MGGILAMGKQQLNRLTNKYLKGIERSHWAIPRSDIWFVGLLTSSSSNIMFWKVSPQGNSNFSEQSSGLAALSIDLPLL